MKQTICIECSEQIEYKKDLRVAGKLLHPYHASCLSNPNTNLGRLHKFIGAFPTGLKFVILMITGNSFLGKLIADNDGSAGVLIFFTFVFNIVFIFARVGIYYSYEKHLK